MATPFGRMLRADKKCFDCLRLFKRKFASKRKKTGTSNQSGNVQVKSLFERQRNEVAEASTGSAETHLSYRALLEQRREQAMRSVLIRVPIPGQDVCDTLLSLGPIHRAFDLNRLKSYVLVEFKHRHSVDKLLQHVSYFPDTCQVPVHSRLLYAMHSNQVRRHASGLSFTPQRVHQQELTAHDLMAADSVCSQMRELHQVRQLSEVGYRLRFFLCSVVEDLVRASLPSCCVQPFGSSSNSFGWEGCDLDMMISMEPLTTKTKDNKFRFLTKRGAGDDRVFGQQCLDVIGEVIRGLMPSAHSVNKVLNARVPIVKFHHEATALDCDLSYINLSGRKMSELMYILGEVQPLARVLMTTVKQWARSQELTRSHPGPWPASFTLLSMVVFFLQTRRPALLPSLRHLQQLAGPSDHFIIEDVDYAFVTDITKIEKYHNTQLLGELLVEFFHFYSQFDFAAHGLSLIEGNAFLKHGDSPMYIENPLDIGHNISYNVSAAYVKQLQEAMGEAVRCLESNSQPDGKAEWGLQCLFLPSPIAQSSGVYDVAHLFHNEEEGKVQGVEDDDEGNSAGVKETEADLVRDHNPEVQQQDADAMSETLSNKDSFSETADATSQSKADRVDVLSQSHRQQVKANKGSAVAS